MIQLCDWRFCVHKQDVSLQACSYICICSILFPFCANSKLSCQSCTLACAVIYAIHFVMNAGGDPSLCGSFKHAQEGSATLHHV